MKNKLRLIDISMLSMYMGRWLTGIVTLFVIAVAIAAYLGDGGRGIERGVITVCVRDAPDAGNPRRAFEPFRMLLGRETRRPVIVMGCGEQQPAGLDLYIMPIHQYLETKEVLNLRALFEIQSTDRPADKAVVISRAPAGEPVPRVESTRDIVFSHPKSVNGFWVQAAALEKNGFEIPDDLRALDFAGTAPGGGRVIADVLCGAHRYGACKLSDVAARIRDGSVRAGELHIATVGDVLPEMVIASTEGEARYFAGKLNRMARLLEADTSPAREDETVELLRLRGIRRLVPLDAGRIAEVQRLDEQFGGVFDSTRVVRP